MGRFLLGYIFVTNRMMAVVGYLPTGQVEIVIKQYSNAGYTVVRKLAGK